MKFRPTESSNNIVDFYKDYLLTTFQTNDADYNRQLKENINKDKAIADGPYISVSDPYKTGNTMQKLVDDGILDADILGFGNTFPEKLYVHQEEAIIKSHAPLNKNLIITTGTGSGKTESFLIPVINELLEEKRNGTLGKGVRSLMVFPMNALANDQMRRIREILSKMPGGNQITFGRFTGETEETREDALNALTEEEKTQIIPNELISREEMRKSPPNILITNYAMLEYILIRPDDNIIFDERYNDKWKFIILDEAHTYSGAKGIEVSTLLHRVCATINRNDIKFILTSATLGDENSNDEIINFGKNLCNANFDAESIIRSIPDVVEPEGNINKVDFIFYRELAESIRNNKNDTEKNAIIQKYGYDNSNDFSSNIYNIVLHDEFYAQFRNTMSGHVYSVSEISNILEVSTNDFIDFVAVASEAMRNGKRLFEAKYHMFVRGIEGVFVTLKPSKKLFIHRMETYNDPSFNNEEFKAYEISFCSNCYALYISGEIENGIFVQKNRMNSNYSPSTFLLNGNIDEETVDPADFYNICSACGRIGHVTAHNGLGCGHSTNYLNKLYKVKDSDEVHSCPCCHSINTQRSILRPYFLGNEASTSVLATGLYNELPGNEIVKRVETVADPLGLLSGDTTVETSERKILQKQFLAFSDNRQNAAYYASYLEQSYMDNIMKRLMYEVVDKNDAFNAGESIEFFVEKLKDLMLEYGISKETAAAKKTAWIYTLKEFSNYKAANSLSSQGALIFKVDYNMPAIPSFGLTQKEANDIFQTLVRPIMKGCGISYPNCLVAEDAKEFTVVGHRKGIKKDTKDASFFEDWLPAVDKSNYRLKYLMKSFDEPHSRELLDNFWSVLFSRLLIENQIFVKENRNGSIPVNAHVIKYEKVIVKKPTELFICDECKTVTPYYGKGICANNRCSGHLRRFLPEEELRDNLYYNLMKNMDISPLKACEHTAQLDSKKAYEYQKDFRDKKINVLSCSTTFEMGVDLGSLETVFMRNMPPSPANYVQRAGRAGRSIKAASYSITYCPNSSHDLNYYRNPTEMIQGKIKPPYINKENEKIVLRHVFACAFASFWKENLDYYTKTIGEFLEKNGDQVFINYFNDLNKISLQKLKQVLRQIVPESLQITFDIENFGWVDKLIKNDPNPDECGLFVLVIARLKDEIERLENAIIAAGRNGRLITNYNFTLNTIKGKKMVAFLAENNLIPKYGFPVDTVSLTTLNPDHASGLNLNRDLFSAISEYAPESEVVADKKIYTSRYVRKLSGYGLPTRNYYVCPSCQKMITTTEETRIIQCDQCGHPINKRTKKYVIPSFGFYMSNDAPEKVTMNNKPLKTYKGSIAYLGDDNVIKYKKYSIYGHDVLIGNSKMDKLAVLNESNFYICDTCGYTEIHDDESDPTISVPHKYHGSNKNCRGVMRCASLGHEFKTDVVSFKFIDTKITDQNKAWTILYALIEGLSKTINVDRNELSGCLNWFKDEAGLGNYALIIFDNTPGGAGYVKQLLVNNDYLLGMFEKAKAVVETCECGGENADTTCYSCLRNYYNQRHHEIMKRHYALSFLNNFVNANRTVTIDETYVDNHAITNRGRHVRALGNNVEIVDNGTNMNYNNTSDLFQAIIGDFTSTIDNSNCNELIEKNCNINSNIKYRSSIRMTGHDETIETFIIWPSKKVMLFTSEFQEEYEILKDNSNWDCYITDNSFDIDEFLAKVGE